MDVVEPSTNQRASPENSGGGTADSKRSVTTVFWACGAAIVGVWVIVHSMHLSAERIFRADECRNVCATWFFATGQGRVAGSPVSLFYLPLVWLSRGATHSVEVYVSARFFSTILLWFNIILLTVAAGQKVISRGSVVALAAAATLVPFWDFGFEIRPDNLVLTGLLLMWCILRVRPAGLQSYFIAGAVAVALFFVDIHSLAYSLPISLAACVFVPDGQKQLRWKPPVAWLVGVAAAALIVRIVYGATGLWAAYVWNRHNSQADEQVAGHWPFVVHLIFQTPLLLAVVVAALVALVMELRRGGTAALSWDSTLPEGLLCVLAFFVFAVNPMPSPYEFLYVVAFAFPLAARFVAKLWNKIGSLGAALPLACGLVLFGHFVPFVVALQKNLHLTNSRQEGLMQLAEAMTAPGKDFVYVEAGLVPTRHTPRYDTALWDQHATAARPIPALRDLFAVQPPSVIIVGNGFDDLPKEDYDYITRHYVPIADDIWILGEILPSGGGTFNVIHPGRYQITSAEASNVRGAYAPKGPNESTAPEPKVPRLTGTLEGVPFDKISAELAAGHHQFNCDASTRPAVAWLGPSLERVPQIDAGDRHHLFVKWH